MTTDTRSIPAKYRDVIYNFKEKLLHCYIIPFAGEIYTTQVVPQLTAIFIFTHVGHTKKIT